jgi:hypothetical protein
MTTEGVLKKLLEGSLDRGVLFRRIGVVRQYLEQVYFTPENKSFLEWCESANMNPDDMESLCGLDEDFWSSFAKDTMYDMVETLRKQIGDLPTIGLYVPFELKNGECHAVGKWLRDNINPTLVLDIHKDESIVGGCAITAAGMWRDYSLRYYMRKKQAEIVGIMTKYVEEDAAKKAKGSVV